MQFRYDLLKSLAFCDAFGGPWERESCYGGVFMENIVAFQERRRGVQLVDQHEHSHGRAHDNSNAQQSASGFLNPQDLLYPCSVLHDKYLQSCYLMQASALLTFLNYDFAQAFPQCERVPVPYDVTCARSLGREISGFTIRNIERAKELCGLGQGDQVQQCLIGAVKDFMLTDASPDPGLALCRSVDGQYKKECYRTVGEISLALFPDQGSREAACRRSERDYVPDCLARLSAD